MKLRTIDTSLSSTAEIQSFLHHAVAPRPICFASTINKNGQVNLSPYSFFNLFSINPPICIFSATSKGEGMNMKNTLENVLEVTECVINIVNYDMVQQTYLTSGDYPKEVNEFSKAGFTELTSELVKPPRVAESNIQMECVVKDVISFGKNNGAGNLIIAEVKLIHVNEDILDTNGKIDPHKMDFVARLGGAWYCRVTSESLFKITKPAGVTGAGMGVDSFPLDVKNSKVLTGNDLGILALVNMLPTNEEVEAYSKTLEMKELLGSNLDKQDRIRLQHLKAKELLGNGHVMDAWKALLI